MTTLYPSHHCFDDALEFVGHRVTRDPILAHGRSLRLVHGILLGPRVEDAIAGVEVVPPDQPFAHAWVEEEVPAGAVVWTSGMSAPTGGELIFIAVPRAIYYATMRVQQKTAYTCREAWEENRASGHYGPWRPEYRQLCRTRKNTSVDV